MRHRLFSTHRALILNCLAIPLLIVSFTYLRRTPDRPPGNVANSPEKASLVESFGKMPLSFEANHGQVNSQVKFFSRSYGYNLFLTSSEAALSLQKANEGNQPATLRMKLAGAKRDPLVSGVDKLPGRINYLLGDDPKRWQTDVPAYAKVKYEGVYPGVDVVYYGNQRQLEYDFIVKPAADPNRIKLNFAGARKLRLDEGGDLIVETGAGELRQRRPVVYQEVGGQRREVPAGYMINDESEVAFEIGEYDAGHELVIDPVLSYSTLLGSGQGGDSGFDIAVDAAGNAYVTGSAAAVPGFPTTPGAIRPTPDPQYSSGSPPFVFVTKFNPQGNQLVYSTLIGGTRGVLIKSSRGDNYRLQNRGYGLAVDAEGNVYVTGEALSSNFPTTPGAFKTAFDGGPATEGFVFKLNAAGDSLLYSTLLGGAASDRGRVLVVDAEGNAYVTGNTDSIDFPTTPGAFQSQSVQDQNSNDPPLDAFVTKLNPTGSALIYSTFLSSGARDFGYGLAVDSAGNAYATGFTFDGYNSAGFPRSAGFPLTPGAYRTPGAIGSAYIVKLNPTGAAVYSAMLGGVENYFGDVNGPVVAVDSTGHAYIAGFARSPVFPTTSGAYRRTGLSDNLSVSPGAGFLTKLSPDGASLVYSTLLGEPNELPNPRIKYPNDIAVDAAGNVYVTGWEGHDDAFVEKFNVTGSALIYSYYFSSSVGQGIAIDGQGAVYFTGGASRGFFATPGAYRQELADLPTSRAAFAAKISETGASGVSLPLPFPTPTPRPPDASPKTIGGRIIDQNSEGVAQVEVIAFSNGALIRGATTAIYGGRYLLTGMPYGGNYTTIPEKFGYRFDPPQRVFTNLTDHAEASFTAIPVANPTPKPAPTPAPSFTISGRVTNASGQGIAGVRVDLGGPPYRVQQTDSEGRYSLTNLPLGGPYTLTAHHPEAVVRPAGYAFPMLSENRTADFSTLTASHVSAASYLGDELPVGSIVAAFGPNLATATQAASAIPLPTQLAGTKIKVLDCVGDERLAPLFYVSPRQINYLMPPGTAGCYTVITVVNSNGVVSIANTQVAAVSPSIFTADATGTGLISAAALRIRADGSRSYEPVAIYDEAQKRIVAAPIDLGPESDQVYLIAFGTGFRYRSRMSAVSAQFSGVEAPVTYAGEQGYFEGLDQCNLLLPRSLAGRGEVIFKLSVDGKTTNGVKVWFK